ncbi:AMMECR1 domain-containing protein [Pelotalea chapellei]|uniref:AMMECR1 domain-containing protein n=1 Tax=Pelotalea chapellei TaxID=44671 RepID=A0ABS5U605_9BACT|nr:AMMECR1 domain-containing protein [Pelotalea chapellei]MBT1071107.1 AMMECR1 domain-containing protein [Pelotalea chapellei]
MTSLRPFILCVALLVLCAPLPQSCAFGAESAIRSTVSESVINSPSGRETVIRYAKGVFLERLGYGPKVDPPAAIAASRRSCFVTFFIGRRVVACFGGFQPRKSTLAEEIDENIRLALLHDERATGIDRRTALEARVQLTFPDTPEPVSSPELISPTREGLFVENDLRGVAIVPGEAKTAAWAYRSAMKRLGESDPLRVRLYRFRAAVVTSRETGGVSGKR